MKEIVEGAPFREYTPKGYIGALLPAASSNAHGAAV